MNIAWVDDFTTDHFANGDYTLPLGIRPSVTPHALHFDGQTYLWLDERAERVQRIPFEIEIDVPGGQVIPGGPAGVGVVGFATTNLAYGSYAGFFGGQAMIVLAIPGYTTLVKGYPVTYPVGAFTIRYALTVDGTATLAIGTQVFTIAVPPDFMTALTTLGNLAPLGYVIAQGGWTLSAWRSGSTGSVVAITHQVGVVRERARQ